MATMDKIEPLTKAEIAEFELACSIIFSCGKPMPGLDRLIYTARIGAEFIEQTSRPGA